ncbi:MAG: shikimate kinase AroK [Gammaproteobacteria bacterium]|nr:shikimate kinase AroK [Gammaproteobacteria bacterium]
MGKQNVFLVGLMAVGKSTVGRLLAQALGADFYDTDHVIEERAGADIAWIFDVEGEAGFRDREEHVIEELSRRQGIVLATGGGVVLRASNRKILAARGVVVHLDSPLERLVERTQRDKKRPLLQQGEARETLARLQAERAPLYEEIADYRFVTDRQGPKVLARMIENKLRDDGAI